MHYLHIGHEFELGLFIFFLIPICYKHFKKTKFKYCLISLIIISLFIGGSLELLGIITTNKVGWIRESFVLILFSYSLILIKKSKNDSYNLMWHRYVLLFLMITILSLIINKNSLLEVLLFIRQFLIVILFFWALLNIKMETKFYVIFRDLIISLFAMQIFANIWKYILTGEYEKVVGTMSISEGSLTTIVSLIGVAFSLLFYFKYKNYKYLLSIIGFVFFAYAGRKRAAAFLIPCIIILTSKLYNNFFSKDLFLKTIKLSIICTIAVLICFIGIKSFSIYNPQGKWAENVDIKYAFENVTHYLGIQEGNSIISNNIYLGRFGGYFALKDLIYNREWMKILFGHGPGILLVSRFLDKKYKAVFVSRKLLGVDVGSRMGFTWLTYQVGFLGSLLFFLFYYNIFKYLRNIISYKYFDIRDKLCLIGMQTFFYIFVFDFFIYSSTTIRIDTITYSFLFMVSYFHFKKNTVN